jgi:hypothetical protein
MNNNTSHRVKKFAPLSLCLAAALVAQSVGSASAASTNSTTTAQSIMVNLLGGGTYAVHENQTWKFNLDAAAALFDNQWDGVAPVVSAGNVKSSKNTAVSVTPGVVVAPCALVQPTPTTPSPDASVVKHNAHPGKDDVVGVNECKLLDGTALVGTTYTINVSIDATCSYVSDSRAIQGGPNAGKFNVETTTLTQTYTFTYTFVVTPLQASYAPFTAWYLIDQGGSGGAAKIPVSAFIAGESVQKSKQNPLKYSFSILNSDGTSRVSGLLVSADGGTPVAATSSVIKNNPADAATLTTEAGQVEFGAGGALDFFYIGNAGTNGDLSLLANNVDARTLLNGGIATRIDTFAGNNNGGADGSALAAAIVDTVDLDLANGDHTITVSGVVKDNSALANLPFTVSKTVHIITAGCGTVIVTP